MLRQFYMNGDLWKVRFVLPYDSVLIDRTGQRTLKGRIETSALCTKRLFGVVS